MFERYRRIADDLFELLPLRIGPCTPGLACWWNRRPGIAGGQFPGQTKDGQVIRGNADSKLQRSSHLRRTRNLIRHGGKAKMLVKEVIGLEPVKQLIVVRAGVAALEEIEVVGLAVQLEEGTHLVVGVGL